MKNIFIICILLILCTACTDNDREKIYLEEAKYYVMEKDWRAAISQLQNFISIENEATIEERAEAWFLMADVRLALNQLEESYEVLKYMLEEPLYDNNVRNEIYKRLISLYDRLNLHVQAAEARTKYALQAHISSEETVINLTEAAKSYQIIAQYKESLLVLDNALEYAIEDNTIKPIEAVIFYYRGYAQNVLEEYDLALASLQRAIEILDHHTLKSSENTLENILEKQQNTTQGTRSHMSGHYEDEAYQNQLRGLIYYLMADIEEVKGNIKEAYAHFQYALDYYPNRVFIQKRIDLLEEKFSAEISK